MEPRGLKLTGLWWWIDRWRKSTAYTDMTLEEQGAYRNLLDEAQLRGGAIPNNERVLAKACGDALAWERVRVTVLARFTLCAEGWRNATLDEVIKESGRRKTNQANYRSRADNNRDHEPDNKAASPSPSPVSVSGTGTGNDNLPAAAGDEPRVESRDVTPPKVETKAETWATQAADDWLELKGGKPPGIMFAQLKPLVREQGWDRVRAPWRHFLSTTEAKYLRIDRFTSMFGEWEATQQGRLPNGRQPKPIPL